MSGRRVVVTGIGIVSPSGVGLEQFAVGNASGRSCVEPYPVSFPELKSRIAAQVRDFDPGHFGFARAEMEGLDRYARFGLVAARLAIDDAGLGATDCGVAAADVGVSFATAIGGTPLMEEVFVRLTGAGEHLLRFESIGPGLYEASMFNSVAGRIGALLGAENACLTVSTGCTAGLDAIGHGYETVAAGDARVVIAGAAEAPLTGITFAAFDVIGALSRCNETPERASRPFDGWRDGFVLSEGAALLVLEELEHARRRGARIYGEVLSFASLNNAYHMTDLPPDGTAMAWMIEDALCLAGIGPEAVDYVNAHGSSTPQNDVFETNAYKQALGETAYRIPVSSTKGMIGHPLSSASAIGTVSALLAIRDAFVPPTINHEHPCVECDLDYVPNLGRRARVDTCLVTASGFSGIHSALVLRRGPETGVRV